MSVIFPHLLNEDGKTMYVYLRELMTTIRERYGKSDIPYWSKAMDQIVEITCDLDSPLRLDRVKWIDKIIKQLEHMLYMIKEVIGDQYLIYLVLFIIDLLKKGEVFYE